MTTHDKSIIIVRAKKKSANIFAKLRSWYNKYCYFHPYCTCRKCRIQRFIRKIWKGFAKYIVLSFKILVKYLAILLSYVRKLFYYKLIQFIAAVVLVCLNIYAYKVLYNTYTQGIAKEKAKIKELQVSITKANEVKKPVSTRPKRIRSPYHVDLYRVDFDTLNEFLDNNVLNIVDRDKQSYKFKVLYDDGKMKFIHATLEIQLNATYVTISAIVKKLQVFAYQIESLNIMRNNNDKNQNVPPLNIKMKCNILAYQNIKK